VVDAGRADFAGIRAGDVLLAVDDVAVRGALDARKALADHRGRLGASTRRVSVALRAPARTADPPRRLEPRPPLTFGSTGCTGAR